MTDVVWLKDFTVEEQQSGVLTGKEGTSNFAVLQDDARLELYPAQGRLLFFPETGNGYARIADNDSLDFQLMTSLGIRFTKHTTTEAVLLFKPNAYKLWFKDSTNILTFGLFIGGEWIEVSSPNPLLLEKEYFVTANFTGSQLNLMINGSLVAVRNYGGDITSSSFDLIIGNDGNNDYQFNGIIREIIMRDVSIDLLSHRDDVKSGFIQSSRTVIELLEINLPTGQLRFTTWGEPINIKVRT